MIKVENAKVYNIARAIYSARNAMNSWDKSDSDLDKDIVGPNDLDLAKRLYNGGPEHRKYLRQIFVSMDITAPDYFFKQFSTYKVGVTENSTSTMHRIHAKEFDINDFSHEHVEELSGYDYNYAYQHWINTINFLNDVRAVYLENKDKRYWWQMIEQLPMSYNYRRSVTMNYENVATIIKQRSGHKITEWDELIAKLKELPYIREIMGE